MKVISLFPLSKLVNEGDKTMAIESKIEVQPGCGFRNDVCDGFEIHLLGSNDRVVLNLGERIVNETWRERILSFEEDKINWSYKGETR